VRPPSSDSTASLTSKDSASKDSASKDSASKDSASKESASKDSAAGDSAGGDKDKAAKPTATDPATSTSGSPASPKPTTGVDTSSIMVRIVPGITRYHKEDCLLIRFLAADDLEVMSLKAAAEEGYFACKACKPDQLAADATS
jgi:hypothetical protein